MHSGSGQLEGVHPRYSFQPCGCPRPVPPPHPCDWIPPEGDHPQRPCQLPSSPPSDPTPIGVTAAKKTTGPPPPAALSPGGVPLTDRGSERSGPPPPPTPQVCVPRNDQCRPAGISPLVLVILSLPPFIVSICSINIAHIRHCPVQNQTRNTLLARGI